MPATRVSIEADVSAPKLGLKELMYALEQTSQAGKKLKDVKLDSEKWPAAAKTLQTIQKNLAEINKTAYGANVAGRAKKFGEADPSEYPMDMDWSKMYARPMAAKHAMRRFWQRLTTRRDVEEAQEQGQDQDVDFDDDSATGGKKTGRNPLAGFGKGVLSGTTSALGMGRLGAYYLGFKAVEKLFTSISEAETSNEQAVMANEPLWKTAGGGNPFSTFIDQAREAGNKLGLLTHEAVELTTAFQKQSGAADAAMVQRMGLATGLARGYGLDPSEMVSRVGKSEFMGMDAKRFALLVGDAVANSSAKGNPALVMDDLLRGVEQLSSTLSRTPSDALVGRYAEMRRAEWENPALRGAAGDRPLSAVQGMMKSGSLPQTAMLYRTFGDELGAGMTSLEKLRAASPLQTVGEVLGKGDANYTIFERLIRQAISEGENLAGDESAYDKGVTGIAKYMGVDWNTARATREAMERMRGNGDEELSAWLKGKGVDYDKFTLDDFAKIPDLMNVRDAKGLGDLEAIKKKYLGGDMRIAAEDREKLQKAKTEGELTNILPKVISVSKMADPVDRLRDETTRGNNYMEGTLGPAMLEMKIHLAEMKNKLLHETGDAVKSIADSTKGIFEWLKHAEAWFAPDNEDERLRKELIEEEKKNYRTGSPTPNIGIEEREAQKWFGTPKYKHNYLRDEKYGKFLEETEKSYGLPRGLLHNLMSVESHGNANAKSPEGATGLFQFLRRTAGDYDLLDKRGNVDTDPVKQGKAAAMYLRKLYRQFRDWSDAVRAYNWGEGNVETFQKTGHVMPGYERKVDWDFDKKVLRGIDTEDTKMPIPDRRAAQMAMEQKEITVRHEGSLGIEIEHKRDGKSIKIDHAKMTPEPVPHGARRTTQWNQNYQKTP